MVRALSYHHHSRKIHSEVVFSDLGGVGTLGKIAGVTEDNAKYSGTTKEDIDNEASVSTFNYIQKLSSDVVEYCMSNDTLLTKLKADSKEEAEEMAAEAGESFEHCFRTIITDAFNSPISKREEDEHRQLRFSQRVYTYGENKQQNKIPLTDASGPWAFSSLRFFLGAGSKVPKVPKRFGPFVCGGFSPGLGQKSQRSQRCKNIEKEFDSL